MKISLIGISPGGVIWRTMRKGAIVSGRIDPPIAIDRAGNYIYPGQAHNAPASSQGNPFVDLPEFFDATPKLEKFFRTLTLKEFAGKWLGLAPINPIVAVHLTGYSRTIHQAEKLCLSQCILRWGARKAIVSTWPTPYTESEFREIQAVKFDS